MDEGSAEDGIGTVVHELPPPQDRAERALLSYVVRANCGAGLEMASRRVLAQVLPAMLWSPTRRQILEAAAGIRDRDETPGIVALFESLETGRSDADAKLSAELIDCAETVVGLTEADVAHWVAEVRDLAARRRLAEEGQRLEKAEGEVPATVERTRRALEDVLDLAAPPEGSVSQSRAIHEAFSDLEAAYQADGQTRGLSTGLADLDALLGGMSGGELIVMAGRPSMGKSALAGAVALHAAEQQDCSVAIVSLEMSRNEIAMRFLAHHSGVAIQAIRQGALTDQDWECVTNAAAELEDLPIHYLDQGKLDWPSLEQRIRLCHQQEGARLVVIDYLQIIDSGRRAENRTQEVGWLSRQIKRMARELDVPILLLSQLSRKCEERQNKRPLLSDLRESGAIEQDADAVVLLYREDYYTPDCARELRGVLEANVAKRRNGATGVAEVLFRRSRAQFTNIEGPGA